MTRLFWRTFFPLLYVVLRVGDPLLSRWTAARGLGNTVELRVAGRHSGSPRRVLVGLLLIGDRRYVGHANATATWTRNLAAAGRGELSVDGAAEIACTAIPLTPGPERDAVVAAAGRQHPFPIDLAYRIAARQIKAEGTFFRLEPVGGAIIPLPLAAARRARARAAAGREPG
jgi:hypothetical protein